jgi:ASC-1-like (ASCH) protein
MPVHVAILLKPYIRLILDGTKTVESRLTVTPRTPYQRIRPGDRIFFKASSGPFMAEAVADRVEFHENLTPQAVARLKRKHNAQVCGDEAYWQWKAHSRYATFIWLRDVKATDRGPAIPPSRGPRGLR